MVAPKKVGDKQLLYVMATEAEYGPALKRRIDPLLCHVGPVEAALRVAHYLAHNPQINLVVSLGSAGSATLQQAHVYQVSHVSYRDMDASAFGFEKGVTPFLGLPAEIELPFLVPDLQPVRLSSGANVISDEGYRTIDADMVDMETWSIMRAAMVAQVPLIGLRGVSDGAEPVAELSDWTRYLHVIDERLADAVDLMERSIVDDRLTRRSFDGRMSLL